MSVRTDHLLPFQKQALTRRLGAGSELGLASVTTYAAHGPAIGSALGLDTFSPTPFQVGSGLMACVYGVRGVASLVNAPRYETKSQTNFRRLLAGADLVTCFGLAAQAFGGGTWATAVSAGGLVTTSALHLWHTYREEL
ncbi:MAG: hypothetical protein AB7S38_39310 [Vulcanimicrobiota bacterium]